KHAVGPVAVVREEQEPLRVRVQTTDRIQALARAEELDHGPAAPLVARGRHDAARLVHHDVAPSRRRRHGALVHADARAGADLRAELGDEAAVHAHAPAGDERFGGAPRGDAAVGESFLEADPLSGVAAPPPPNRSNTATCGAWSGAVTICHSSPAFWRRSPVPSYDAPSSASAASTPRGVAPATRASSPRDTGFSATKRIASRAFASCVRMRAPSC